MIYRMRFWLLLLLAMLPDLKSYAQGVDTEEHFTESRLVLEPNSEVLVSDQSLQELVERPININNATLEELVSSGILSPNQAAALVEHRIRFGSFVDIRELQVVSGFDPELIRWLQPFITLGFGKKLPQGGWRRVVKEGGQQLLVRAQFIPEEKSGYSTRYGRPAYEGSPLGCYVRYRFESMGRLRWGVTAEKDPGEAFFKGSRKDGFDFYSFHFFVKDVGRVRTLALGDYSLSYGQGLVFSNGGRGVPADPCMILAYGNGIRPYTSVG
ncbi:MAG: ComEA family DNA-binding protein, partial [Bacteroidota bacterium]